MAAVLSFSALTSFNSAEADSSPESVAATNSNGALPTSASSDSGKGPIRADSDANRPPNAAAVIDGHVIPLDQVQTTCLRDFGPRVVDKMVQAYVIDREAEKRGIKISPQDVDAELDRLKKAVAPATIDQLLTAHHQTLVMLKDDIHQELERRLLLADKIKPTKMTRCRVIFVKFDDPKASGGVKIRSESAAIAIVQRIEKRLDAGDDFANLARKFSEDPNAASGGDVGVVYSGAHANDVLVSAALGLKKGEITKTPVRIFNGYYLIQAVSTSDDRSASENALYTDAEGIYRDQQAQFLIGAYLYDLIQKSDVVYYVHD
jgi:parvulin-like peptidyl-prolyl isomerase